MERRVVITGVGVVSSIGQSAEEFWKNALKAETSVEPIPKSWTDRSDYRSTLWSPLKPLHLSNSPIDASEKVQLDPSSTLAIMAAADALKSANLVTKKTDEKRNSFVIEGVDQNRAGVFLGTGVAGIQSTLNATAVQTMVKPALGLEELSKLVPEDLRAKVLTIREQLLFPRRFNPHTIAMSMPNAAAARLSLKFGLNGPSRTFCAACAASTISIGEAFKAVANGEVDFALTGGTEYLFEDWGGIFRGFDTVGALVRECGDPDRANRPFDKGRTGFLFSQGGAGALVLEELSSAVSRGARILAEVKGFAESNDAFSMAAIDREASQIKRMLTSLISKSGASFADIDYINAHGTGTELNDDIESGLIEEFFGDKPLVNSTKSLIGHTLGASGALEAIVTTLSIANQRTHPTRNLEDPIRSLNFALSPSPVEIEWAISQSFGFGGHNAAIILKRYE